MNSIKCPNCGLVNFASEENCKRCQHSLTATPCVQPLSVTAQHEEPARPQTQNHSKDCPQCASPETRSFEMAYATSTSTGTLIASSYNFNGGGMTMTGGNIRQQSALAAYVTPPPRPQSAAALTGFMILFGFLVGLSLCYVLTTAGYTLFGLLLFFVFPVGIGCPVWRSSAREYAQKLAEYHLAVAHWRRSWICLRCGHRWALS